MDTLTVVCFAVPMLSFGTTVVKNWDSVLWIHAPRHHEAKMAARKKAAETWHTKDGKEIFVPSMEDKHLVNAIKMVARNCHKSSYRGDVASDKTMLKLVNEGNKRGWKISFLSTPINNNGQNEWVDVWIPTSRSKLSMSMYISDWDSRAD